MAMIMMERDTIRHLTDPADVTRWEGYGYHVVADPAPAPSVEAPEAAAENTAPEAAAEAAAEAGGRALRKRRRSARRPRKEARRHDRARSSDRRDPDRLL